MVFAESIVLPESAWKKKKLPLIQLSNSARRCSESARQFFAELGAELDSKAGASLERIEARRLDLIRQTIIQICDKGLRALHRTFADVVGRNNLRVRVHG